MLAAIEAFARERLMEWLPGAKVQHPSGAAVNAVDAVLVWQGPKGTIRYGLTFKKHLPQQDIQVLARRLEDQVRNLSGTKVGARLLILAPYIPAKQAAYLRSRGIDYADEAGNAHLEAPGVLVHIEGRRAAKTTSPKRGITKGWVKVTLAGLLNPGLFDGPYHHLGLPLV